MNLILPKSPTQVRRISSQFIPNRMNTGAGQNPNPRFLLCARDPHFPIDMLRVSVFISSKWYYKEKTNTENSQTSHGGPNLAGNHVNIQNISPSGNNNTAKVHNEPSARPAVLFFEAERNSTDASNPWRRGRQILVGCHGPFHNRGQGELHGIKVAAVIVEIHPEHSNRSDNNFELVAESLRPFEMKQM
jgi:hypothetical protein